MCDVPVFVDLQGFIVRDKFVAKEIAVLIGGKSLTHRVFRPPMSWDLLNVREKSQAGWLINNHHRLRWEDGDADYAQSRRTLRRTLCDSTEIDSTGTTTATRTVYVKGPEKIAWLRALLGDAADEVDMRIESIDSDFEDVASLNELNASRSYNCGRHSKHCAMENVGKMHVWWTERVTQLRNACEDDSELTQESCL